MRIPRFTRVEWATIIAVGVITPLVDSRVEVLVPQFFYSIRDVVNVFDFTGGPVNSDLLVAWEEYGGVLAAFLVRKPGAATIAMIANGFGQYLIDGFQGPHHLLYGVTGLGADFVFALYRYRRFDAKTSALAGLASQLSWIPITYSYHNVLPRFPVAWIEGDLFIRAIAGFVGDGLVGAAIGFLVLSLARKLSQRRAQRGSAAAAPEGTLPATPSFLQIRRVKPSRLRRVAKITPQRVGRRS